VTEEKLVFLAGDRALEAIRSRGLSPEDVEVVAGAAGGPKWLILSRLDRLISRTPFLQGPFAVGSNRFKRIPAKSA